MDTVKKCSFPGCDEDGTYPAPASPDDIRQRIYFCLKHVREYNKKWNGLDGFSTQQIFGLQHGAATWNRPTWQMGHGSETYKKARLDENYMRDPFVIFGNRKEGVTTESSRASTIANLPTAIYDACLLLGLQKPLTTDKLKRQYRIMAKKYHPDLNKGDNESVEMLKRINHAYSLVLRYINRYDK